jgi:hypothetical protein
MEPKKKYRAPCQLGQHCDMLPHNLTQTAGHNSESKKDCAETQDEED